MVTKCMFFVLRPDYKNKSDHAENEAARDRIVTPTTAMTASNSIHVTRVSSLADHEDQSDRHHQSDTCRTCFENICECLWMSVAVRCVRSAPKCCDGTGLCSFIDRVCIIFTNLMGENENVEKLIKNNFYLFVSIHSF